MLSSRSHYFKVKRVYDRDGQVEKVTYLHVLAKGMTPECHYGKSVYDQSLCYN